MISLSAAVYTVVYLIVAGLIFWVLWWLLNYLNPPEPFKKVGTVVLAVLGALVVIGILLSLVGNQAVFRP